MSKKIESTDQEGDDQVREDDTTSTVETCCVCAGTENVMVCGGCKATRYCSKECQRRHHSHHAVYCSNISALEDIEKAKLWHGKNTVHQRQDDLKLRRKILKLVGEEPMVQCLLGGKQCDMLWDTGSMISMVDRKWVR